MTLPSGGQAAPPFVESFLNYLAPGEGKPYRYTYEPPSGVPVSNTDYEPHKCRIYDARSAGARASLDREGFALVQHRSAVSDFYNNEEVRRVYYPEAERLLIEAAGALRVHIFDHTVRRRPSDRPELDSGRSNGGGPRGPVGRVHNDFTARSGPTRLRLELGAEAEALRGLRFAVINVWRSIRGAVLDAPLAVCDARSVAPDDFVPSDLIYRDRVGEVYQVRHNPEHRWFYVPALQEDEALLLKCYDSATDGRARFAPHTAFEDPGTPSSAPPRESIELRAFVFFPR